MSLTAPTLYTRGSAFLLCLIITLLYSCAPTTYTYIKTIPNTPFLREQGDRNINVNFNTNKVEIQGAYSPVNHIGIQANSFISSTASYGELVGGYYQPVKDIFLWEVYGGMGYGDVNQAIIFQENTNLNRAKSFNTHRTNAQYARYLIQTGIAYTSDWIKLGISLRSSYAHYYGYNYAETTTYLDFNDQNRKVEVTSTELILNDIDIFSVTPVFHFEAGNPSIAGTIRIGQSIPLYGYVFQPIQYPKFNPFIFSMGVRFSPGARRKSN